MTISTEILITVSIIALLLLFVYLYYDRNQSKKSLTNAIEAYKAEQEIDTVDDVIYMLDLLPVHYSQLTQDEIKEVGRLINEYHEIIYSRMDIEGLRDTTIHVRQDLKLARKNLTNLAEKDVKFMVDEQLFLRNQIKLLMQVLVLYKLKGASTQ